VDKIAPQPLLTLLVHLFAMVYLLVILKKNKLTRLLVAMTMTQQFFLTLASLISMDLLLTMAMWLVLLSQ
jgi:hypothetical protein